MCSVLAFSHSSLPVPQSSPINLSISFAVSDQTVCPAISSLSVISVIQSREVVSNLIKRHEELSQYLHGFFVTLGCARIEPLAFHFVTVDVDLPELCDEGIDQTDLAAVRGADLRENVERRTRDQVMTDDAERTRGILGLRFLHESFHFLQSSFGERFVDIRDAVFA